MSEPIRNIFNELRPSSDGLFQLDIEQPNTIALYRYVSRKLNKLLFEQEPMLPDSPSLFQSGLKLELDIQFWFEPGHYINSMVQVSFHYVRASMRNGIDVAPHQITCSTSVKYPIDTEYTFIAENRTGLITDLAMDIVYSLAFIIQKIGDLILSELDTE